MVAISWARHEPFAQTVSLRPFSNAISRRSTRWLPALLAALTDRRHTLEIMVTIRSATLADATSLFDLVRAFPTPTPPNAEQFSSALRAKLPDPASCLLVAEHDGRLVGYVSGYCHPAFYAGGPTAWVDELFVSELLRGTGIGRQLMDAFERWAQDRQCVLVSLATRGAAAFYERRGYTSSARYYKRYLGQALRNHARPDIQNT